MAQIPYKKLPRKLIVGASLIVALGGATVAQLTMDTIADHEGYVPVGYLDPVGIPTKCFGDTTDVVVGQEYTFEECSRSITSQVEKHALPIRDCVPTLSQQPDGVQAAAYSMTYNIGVTGFCESSVARYFRAGQWERGCRRIAEIYKTAKGKELPGLVKRRKFESDMCLQGLAAAK